MAGKPGPGLAAITAAATPAGRRLIRPGSEYIGVRAQRDTAGQAVTATAGGATSVTEQPADPARAMAVPPASQIPPPPGAATAPPAAAVPPAATAPPAAAVPPAATAPPAAAVPPAEPVPVVSASSPGPRRLARRSAVRPPRAARADLRWRAQFPYWLSLLLMLAGLAWIWYGGSERVRVGTLTVAIAMLVAAFARLVLPPARAGLLVSRRRLVDVVVLAVLAVGLLVTGLVLPAPI